MRLVEILEEGNRIIKFLDRELNIIVHCCYSLIEAGERMPAGYKSILTTIEKTNKGPAKLELSIKEIMTLIKILQNYMKKIISDKNVSSIWGQVSELKKELIKAYYNA